LEQCGEHSVGGGWRMLVGQIVRIKDKSNVLCTVKGRLAGWLLVTSCDLPKPIIEGKIEGTGRRGRRREEVLDGFKGKRS
jgi:hypothetical protein